MTTHVVMRVIGIVVALGFMILSAIINWRYGKTLARSGEDQLIFASASLLVDIAKATAPFLVVAAIHFRRWPHAVAAASFWLVCTSYSLSMLIGYHEQHRVVAAGSLSAERVKHRTLIEELNRKRSERELLGAIISPIVSGAAIERMRQERRWTVSKGCTIVSGVSIRKYCVEFKSREVERQKGLAAERLDQQLRELTAAHEKTAAASGRDESDPRSGVIARAFGLSTATVDIGLLIVFLCVIELGSGLGLFIAVVDAKRVPQPGQSRVDEARRAVAKGGARQQTASQDGAPRLTDDEMRGRQVCIGDVAKFARDCMAAAPGRRTTIEIAYGAYGRWCAERRLVPISLKDFEVHLIELVGRIGLDVETRAAGAAVRHVVFG